MKGIKIKNVGVKVQKGFTLIELMITVAIVGILASIALPAYQDYTIRAQVAEGFQLVWGLQTAVNEVYTTTGVLAADNAALSMTSEGVIGKYITSVVNNRGELKITYGNKANVNITGKYINLTAIPDPSGVIHWSCSAGDIPVRYIPSSCR